MSVNTPTPPPAAASSVTSKLSWLRRHRIRTGLGVLVLGCGVATVAVAGHTGGHPAVTGNPGPSAASAGAALMSCMRDPNVKSVSVDAGSFVSSVEIRTTIGGDEGPNLAQDDSDDAAGRKLVADFQRCATAADGPNGLVSVHASDGSVLASAAY
jgi:hypothetical protein